MASEVGKRPASMAQVEGLECSSGSEPAPHTREAWCPESPSRGMWRDERAAGLQACSGLAPSHS